MARGSLGPREFVRFSPFQFSLLIGIVVLLMAGAGIAGYLYGLGETKRKAAGALVENADISMKSEPSSSGTTDPSPVTFYSALTEGRDEKPTPSPPPEPPPPAPKETVQERTIIPPEGGSVMVQVASYKSREAAQDLLEKLSAEGFGGAIETADLAERGTWFRVRIGPFRDERDAGMVLEKLREEKDLKGFIVR